MRTIILPCATGQGVSDLIRALERNDQYIDLWGRSHSASAAGVEGSEVKAGSSDQPKDFLSAAEISERERECFKGPLSLPYTAQPMVPSETEEESTLRPRRSRQLTTILTHNKTTILIPQGQLKESMFTRLENSIFRIELTATVRVDLGK